MSTSATSPQRVYAVLGGSNPAVVSNPPFLAGSHTAPIMPIVIKCTSTAEANAAMGLQPLFRRFNCHKVDEEPEVFAKALLRARDIPDLFAAQGPFYAVWRGKTQRAIYVKDFIEVEKQIHDYSYPKWRKFASITEALVFMVMKGDPDKTLALINASRIVDTVYGSTSGLPEYAIYNVGKHASRYLGAHGYTQDTITEIERIWSTSETADEFVDSLVLYGMAATEVRWLWDLTQHSDNCGY
ncbi:hypothetical protein C8R43DRAFT_1128033 [Mycena crocata]|nr:hypothetical protein C8R43DRAFT_1128033 [Mycena crocata]